MNRARQFFGYAVLLAAACFFPQAAAAQAFSPFVGNFSGETHGEIEAGKREKLKCNAYNSMAGAALKVVVRCAGSGGAIRIAAQLSESGGTIKGSWKEAQFNIDGSLSGKVNANVITGTINSPNFNAKVTIQRTGSGLQIKIEPSGKDLRISVNMS